MAQPEVEPLGLCITSGLNAGFLIVLWTSSGSCAKKAYFYGFLPDLHTLQIGFLWYIIVLYVKKWL